MEDDSYMRKDDISYCNLYGHEYFEISREERRLKTKEKFYDIDKSLYERIRATHGVDIVTYGCKRCGNLTKREENEF